MELTCKYIPLEYRDAVLKQYQQPYKTINYDQSGFINWLMSIDDNMFLKIKGVIKIFSVNTFIELAGRNTLLNDRGYNLAPSGAYEAEIRDGGLDALRIIYFMQFGNTIYGGRIGELYICDCKNLSPLDWLYACSPRPQIIHSMNRARLLNKCVPKVLYQSRADQYRSRMCCCRDCLKLYMQVSDLTCKDNATTIWKLLASIYDN
jgi:hypothetical protein